MNTCTCCFEDFLVKCTDTIDVFAQLTANASYYWVITDKFDRQYSGTVMTDGSGYSQIPITDLPDGLLTEYSGSFTLQFFEQQEHNKPVVFRICQQADCISFTVHPGTREKNNLGLD